MNGIWQNAEEAALAARALLQLGHVNSAVDRAYYAMFSAARVALRSVDPKLDHARTHQTIIGRLGLHLVKTGKLDTEMGRLLHEAETLRLAAAYEDEPIDPDEARIVVERMEQFMNAVRTFPADRQT